MNTDIWNEEYEMEKKILLNKCVERDKEIKHLKNEIIDLKEKCNQYIIERDSIIRELESIKYSRTYKICKGISSKIKKIIP